MAFDGIVLHALTNELRTQLLHGRINKIYQPTKNELIFTIRNNRKNYSLLFSIHPVYARMHLTEQSYTNPEEPPMFCMVLRKHLQGAVITNISQFGLERIVQIDVQGRNEIGDQTDKTFMIELMGKHSNIILLNDAKEHIVTCMKLVSSAQNRFRTLLPGSLYTLPPAQDKLDILQTEPAQIVKKLDFNTGQLDRQLMQHVAGISLPVAKEIVHEANLGDMQAYENSLLALKNRIEQNEIEPAIYDGDKSDYHVIPLHFWKTNKQLYPSVSDMLEAFYRTKADRDRVKQVANDMYRKIRNNLAKVERKIVIHEKSLKQAARANKQQHYGELLTAHMHLITRGDASIDVVDYYDPDGNTVTIPLQQDKTPSENAQLYFKRYRKLITAQKKAAIEKKLALEEKVYLENILQQLDVATDQDVEEIREELQAEGILKRKSSKKQKKKRHQPKPEHYIASDGTSIFVGKNNLQNEYVTHRLAKKEHIWLHTLDIPGSHVVIQSENPSEETLLEAAQLAAYFSKGRDSASVPVDYTKIKYVKKPSGAKPGFVTYTDQKTLFVTPKEAFIAKLEKRA